MLLQSSPTHRRTDAFSSHTAESGLCQSLLVVVAVAVAVALAAAAGAVAVAVVVVF